MDNLAEVQRIMRENDDAFEKMRPALKAYRAAYEDDFWQDVKEEESGDSRVLMQVNRIRPWVVSYVASLFYKAMRVVVQPDDVVRPEEIDLDTAPDTIQKVINRFLNTEGFRGLAKQAFTVGLMYPQFAFKLCVDRNLAHPVDQVYPELLMPWECVWDRRARSRRSMRYIGHAYYCSREELISKYGALIPADLKTCVAPDAIAEGLSNAVYGNDRDESYVRVLELNDLVTEHAVQVEIQAQDELGNAVSVRETVKTRGKFCVYLLGQGGTGDKPMLLSEGPLPYAWPDGSPAPNIVPALLAHLPEYEMWGIAPVATVYELVKELNHAATYLAQGFRKDAARVLLYLKDRIDQKSLNDIESGRDHAMVGIEGETLDQIAKWLESPGVAATMLQYRNLLAEGMDDVQGTAPVTRGTPTKYVTATESERLNDYTETTLGTYREGMDRSIGEVSELYLRVLAAAMADAGMDSIQLRIQGGKEIVTLPRDALNHRWSVTLAESASTPMKEAQKRGELQEAMKPLIELAATAAAPETPPEMKVLSKRILDLVVKLYDLPEDMLWDRLAADGRLEAPPPPPMPPPGAGVTPPVASPAGGVGPLPPEVMNAVAPPAPM